MRSTHPRLLFFILWACLAVNAACALSFSVCSVPSLCASVGKIERTQRASFPQTWSYDTENNVLSHTDRNAKVTTYSYDKENRKIATTRDGLNRGRLAYDGEGRVIESTDPENRTTRFTLDAAGRVTHTRLPNGILRIATYTPSGDIATSDNGEGQVTSFQYDVRRRTISETNPTSETTRFVYDNANNLRRSIGAKFVGELPSLGIGCTAPTGADTYLTTFCYDNADRLSSVIDPNGDQTHYSYDRNDNLIAVLEPGDKKSEFQYDARNRRIQKKSADLATGPPQIWTWTHDGTGDVLTQTDPSGALSTHSYDVLNRRSATTIANAPAGSPSQQAYQYDPNGNVTQRSELNGSQSYVLSFLYDAFNRPYQITDANGRIWRQTFNAADERGTLDSNGIPRVSWNYDSNGRPVQISVAGAGVFDLAYDKADRNTTITNPNGVVTTHQFDAAGRITEIRHARNGGTVALFQYRYDANGNRIEQIEQNGGATSIITFTYDEADRLIAITESGKHTEYTLDANGNRIETKEGPVAGQITKRLVSTFDNRNQIINQKEYNGTGILVATTTFNFDANGNLTGRTNGAAQTQWRYDALDRLIETTPPTGPPTQYRYGPGDVRIATIRAGMETRHHYDGERLILETNVLGNPSRHYAYSSAGLLSTVTLGGTPQYRYAHLDAQTSPIAITATNGNILNRSHFDPYGVETNLYGTRDQAISFQGYWSGIELEETGNLLSAARIYIPGLGIYGERDPVEGNAREPILFNPYLIGRSNPHRWLDPDGRLGVDIGIVNCAAQGCRNESVAGSALHLIDPAQMGSSTQAAALHEAQMRSLLFAGGRTDDANVVYPLIATGAGRFKAPRVLIGADRRLADMQEMADFHSALGSSQDYTPVGATTMEIGGMVGQSVLMAVPPFAIAHGVSTMANAESGGEFAMGILETVSGGLGAAAIIRAELAAVRSSPRVVGASTSAPEVRFNLLHDEAGAFAGQRPNLTPPQRPGKTRADNEFFTNKSSYDTSGIPNSTGYIYDVFQRSDIDWNLMRTTGAKRGRDMTNAEAASRYGLGPILPDGSIATLHHSQQSAIGPLFEASTRYHRIANAQRAPLHPFGETQHPYYPLGRGPGSVRESFQRVDSLEYWKMRGTQELP